MDTNKTPRNEREALAALAAKPESIRDIRKTLSESAAWQPMSRKPGPRKAIKRGIAAYVRSLFSSFA